MARSCASEQNGTGHDLADFNWMDAWQVHVRIKLAANEFNAAETISQMTGEGLMVEKTEAASALVHWEEAKFGGTN